MAVACHSPLSQLVYGVYTRRLGSSKYLLLIVSSAVDQFQLLLADVGTTLALKYVPKSCITRSNKLVSNHLLICCPVLDSC